MRRVTPLWKVLVALTSTLLALAIWGKGLQDSFSRPSVAPRLSINQQEIALLAEPSLPKFLKPILAGSEPKNALKDALFAIPAEQMDERQQLILITIDSSLTDRYSILEEPLKDSRFFSVQRELRAFKKGLDIDEDSIYESTKVNGDFLLSRLACEAIGGEQKQCIDISVARDMALRLSFSQGFPVIAVLLGVGLCLRQTWLWIGKRSLPWPELLSPPLTVVDMVILVSGGFVVLGEVIAPVIVSPLTQAISAGFNSPLRDSLMIFVGYCAMASPPLFILRRQLIGIDNSQKPSNGWLQFYLKLWPSSLLDALKGWLMVLPFVLLVGWLMTLLIGDQGGSNPLLGLVLTSKDPLSLTLLIITTVVLAPLFEETVFRGALLPVLARSFGRFGGVLISAIVFGIAHLSVGELPPLIVLGIGLALLRLSSGRLLPCVMMHALWNGITFLNLIILGN